jgi:uncharacterized membrane protein YqjE
VTTAPQSDGPAGAARALGADLLALLRLRAELVAVELEEEAARRKRMVLLGAVTAVFALATLLLVAFLVVVVFWNVNRIAALGGVTLVYGLAGLWGYLRYRDLVANSPPPFAATLAEFRKDLEIFRGNDGQG